MSLVIRSPLLRIGLIAVSLAAFVLGAMTRRFGLFTVAVLLLLPIASSLSPAGRLAVALQNLKGRDVGALVWGEPIGGDSASRLRVWSVGAVGAGLLIRLVDEGEAKTLLKIAQPRAWVVEEDRMVIREAAYVQWAGKRLVRAEGSPAVVLTAASGVA